MIKAWTDASVSTKRSLISFVIKAEGKKMSCVRQLSTRVGSQESEYLALEALILFLDGNSLKDVKIKCDNKSVVDFVKYKLSVKGLDTLFGEGRDKVYKIMQRLNLDLSWISRKHNKAHRLCSLKLKEVKEKQYRRYHIGNLIYKDVKHEDSREIRIPKTRFFITNKALMSIHKGMSSKQGWSLDKTLKMLRVKLDFGLRVVDEHSKSIVYGGQKFLIRGSTLIKVESHQEYKDDWKLLVQSLQPMITNKMKQLQIS